MGHTDGGAALVGELPAFLDEWRQVHKKVSDRLQRPPPENNFYPPERCWKGWKGFVASPHHLAFGLLVGDALELHAFYGALFNPTGGLVGDGNQQLTPILFLNPRMQVHGVTHDASGHLFNFHHRGPGYPYLGYECCTGNLPASCAFPANILAMCLCPLPCIHRANHSPSISQSANVGPDARPHVLAPAQPVVRRLHWRWHG